MKFSSVNAFVTGGASGLGEATVRRIVDRGGRALIADVQMERGEAVAKELGDHARFRRVDVTSEEDVAAALKEALEVFGALNVVVSCGGIAVAKKVLGKKGPHDLASFQKVVTTNLVGTFNVMRLASEVIAEQDPLEDGERGVIVNTASVAAFEGQIGQIAYSASKAGVVGMTLPAARELARHGIRVCTIAPGLFDTPLMAGLPEKARNSLADQIPFPQRFGEPSEFAQLVDQIVQNPMLNGEVIRLDGAIRMAPR